MTEILRPSADAALAEWAARIRANREQAERVRGAARTGDFYAPIAQAFRAHPHRTGDETLDVLRALAVPGETWIDIGAGGGRYALPLALGAREVIAVEPSAGMRAVLAAGMEESGIANVRVIDSTWPMVERPQADVALIAHVGYDVEAIGPFLEAMEAAASRLCVAVLVAGSPPIAAEPFWPPIHGEARHRLPGLAEFLVLLLARGVLPEVRMLEREPMQFDDPDGPLTWLHQQLFIPDAGPKSDQLRAMVRERVSERDGRWAVSWETLPMGVVSWVPRR
jgi:hypothetical protein